MNINHGHLTVIDTAAADLLTALNTSVTAAAAATSESIATSASTSKAAKQQAAAIAAALSPLAIVANDTAARAAALVSGSNDTAAADIQSVIAASKAAAADLEKAAKPLLVTVSSIFGAIAAIYSESSKADDDAKNIQADDDDAKQAAKDRAKICRAKKSAAQKFYSNYRKRFQDEMRKRGLALACEDGSTGFIDNHGQLTVISSIADSNNAIKSAADQRAKEQAEEATKAAKAASVPFEDKAAALVAAFVADHGGEALAALFVASAAAYAKQEKKAASAAACDYVMVEHLAAKDQRLAEQALEDKAAALESVKEYKEQAAAAIRRATSAEQALAKAQADIEIASRTTGHRTTGRRQANK